MITKVNEAYNITTTLVDNSNNPVLNETPILYIKRLSDNKYYNGFTWTEKKFYLIMSHIGNGVYLYRFTPTETGLYEIWYNATSLQLSAKYILEVIDNNNVYTCTPNEHFLIKIPYYSGIAPSIRISKVQYGTTLYFDGVNWITDIINLSMDIIENQFAIYDFVPTEIGEYYINIRENDVTEHNLVLNVNDNVVVTQPVVVNSYNCLYVDGTDSVVYNTNKIPLSGVKVSAYNQDRSKIVNFTFTNEKGEWSMVLPVGTYYFVFEKNGYISTGFERQVG